MIIKILLQLLTCAIFPLTVMSEGYLTNKKEETINKLYLCGQKTKSGRYSNQQKRCRKSVQYVQYDESSDKFS